MAAIGEDSSRQDMKKKQRANRYTTGPADGSDRTRDLSLGSAGRDQVLQLTVSGA